MVKLAYLTQYFIYISTQSKKAFLLLTQWFESLLFLWHRIGYFIDVFVCPIISIILSFYLHFCRTATEIKGPIQWTCNLKTYKKMFHFLLSAFLKISSCVRTVDMVMLWCGSTLGTALICSSIFRAYVWKVSHELQPLSSKIN